MKDTSCNGMSAAGGKGNVHDKAREHHRSGCRSSVDFLIERETSGIGVTILLTGGYYSQ